MGNDINLEEVFQERADFADILGMSVSNLLSEKDLKRILFEDEIKELEELLKNVDLLKLEEFAEYIAYNPARY